ncbi:MAG TPA: DUF5818 domain-containing protein [Candidatus Sulfotelmatobacter sp.]|nr:DUF5818 domain-containing protein [Candidatus Sulfotelmatobacter sp.]
MKKFLSLSSFAALAIVLGMVSWGSSLNAQTAPSTTPGQSTQSPDSTPSQTPSTQSPDSTPSQTPSTQQPPAPETPPASQQTPSSQTPSSQTPPSQTPDTTAPQSGSRSGSTAGSATDNASGAQTFTGTVVKQGDKYVLKDDAGKTYDIDHQTDVAKFEGKRVRVQGTLDPNGKIMVK